MAAVVRSLTPAGRHHLRHRAGASLARLTKLASEAMERPVPLILLRPAIPQRSQAMEVPRQRLPAETRTLRPRCCGAVRLPGVVTV